MTITQAEQRRFRLRALSLTLMLGAVLFLLAGAQKSLYVLLQQAEGPFSRLAHPIQAFIEVVHKNTQFVSVIWELAPGVVAANGECSVCRVRATAMYEFDEHLEGKPAHIRSLMHSIREFMVGRIRSAPPSEAECEGLGKRPSLSLRRREMQPLVVG